jgi:hypothetical protein
VKYYSIIKNQNKKTRQLKIVICNDIANVVGFEINLYLLTLQQERIIMKKLLFISLYMLPMIAMDPERTQDEITQQCFNNLQNINQDREALYFYFKGVFQAVGKGGDVRERPSLILNRSAHGLYIDLKIRPAFMPATEYLKTIVARHYDTLDAAFVQKYSELKDVQKTWEWFDGHFKQKGLIEPLKAFVQVLVKADVLKLDFAKKGIAVSVSADGSTLLFS